MNSILKKRKKLSFFIIGVTLALLIGNVAIIQTVNAYDYNNSLTYDSIVWYRVNLKTGTQINLALIVPTGCDFDLYLTNTIILAQNMAGRWIPEYDLESSINTGDSDESILYNPTMSGIFFVAVHCHSGSGTYTLSSNYALEIFYPILEIVIIVVIIIGIISAICIMAFVIYRRRRNKSDSEFFDKFYDNKEKQLE